MDVSLQELLRLQPQDGPRVVCIVGSQRGGTTVAGRLLSSLDGAVFLGETLHLFRSGERRETCGCGADRRECPVWRGNDADPLVDDAPKRDVLDAVGGSVTSGQAADRAALRLTRMFEQVHEATSGALMIDTSKSPLYGALLQRRSPIPTAVIHLVRDPRGVAASVKRRSATAGISGLAEMAKFGLHWWKRQGASARVVRRTSGVTIRYEDLVRDPAATLGVDGLATPTSSWLVPPGHCPVSNGYYADAKVVTLREDTRHLDELTRTERILIAATTPSARRYGYGR